MREQKNISPQGEGKEDFQEGLLRLLAQKTERYTAGESSSVPIETAQRLLQSVCFTLGMDLTGNTLNFAHLAGEDLDRAYDRGLQHIQKKIQRGRNLWEAAVITVPSIENISLQDTLKSMEGFWKKYDHT